MGIRKAFEMLLDNLGNIVIIGLIAFGFLWAAMMGQKDKVNDEIENIDVPSGYIHIINNENLLREPAQPAIG